MNAPINQSINQLGRFCLFLVISIFLFAGYSFFDFDKENTASVVFEIPDNFTNKLNTRESRQILSATSREALTFEDDIFYFDIALKGGFEDSKTIQLGKEKRFSFDDIPVGSELWAEAEIYKNEADSKVTLYTGKSEVITVVAGENQLALKLEKSDSENQDSSEPEIIYVDIYATARTLAANELCDGSEEAPFATIADALAYITGLDNSEENYKIITSGTFAENVLIQSIPAAHLMIEGDGGEVESKITGNGVSGYPFESYQNITLKNISVIANGNLGANIHAGRLTLDGNSKIKCTAAETTGSYGVYVSGSIVMKGSSEISGFKQTSGYTVYVQGASASLVMKDDSKIYDCKTAIGDGQGGGVYVGKGSLEMYDNAKIYNCQSKYGAGVYVYSGSVTMNGHSKITDCTGIANSNSYGVGSYGGGLYIVCESGSSAANATLTMNDYAAIESCTANIGGGVYVNGTDLRSGIVTMNGNSVITTCTGSMINNTNNRYSAGGVDVDSYGKLTIDGNARITDCTGDKSGAGGVYSKGTVEMNGGEISGNETGYYQNMVEYGVGGVDIEAGTFTMKGGEIKSNNGCGCGGVRIGSSATFDMQGGVIGGNTSRNGKASGVMVSYSYSGNTNGGAASSTGTFKISGNVRVEDDNEVTVIYTNGTRKTIPTVVTVSGPLTANGTVARIAFYSVDSSTGSSSLAYYEGDQIISISNGAGTSFDEILSKFTIKPKVVDSVTTNYMLDGGGKLRVKKAAPDAVGDIVFNDGTAVAYHDNLSLSATQKARAIAVVFYNGTEGAADGNSRILGVGLKHSEKRVWCTSEANFYGKSLESIQTGSGTSGSGPTMTYYFYGDLNGKDNLSNISEFLQASENGTTDDTEVTGHYPAFEFAKNYAAIEGSHVSSTDYASGWWLPSAGELYKIWLNKSTVNDSLVACNSSSIGSVRYYWSASQYGNEQNKAYVIDFENQYGAPASGSFLSESAVCAIREF